VLAAAGQDVIDAAIIAFVVALATALAVVVWRLLGRVVRWMAQRSGKAVRAALHDMVMPEFVSLHERIDSHMAAEEGVARDVVSHLDAIHTRLDEAADDRTGIKERLSEVELRLGNVEQVTVNRMTEGDVP